MTTLVLKLALTPVLIAGASLAGRRWGASVSGWLVGLPLTTAPVAAFLAAEHGPRFAGRTMVGSLSGAGAEVAFCIAYARCAARGRAVSLLAATAVFATVGAATEALPLSPRLPSPLLPTLAGAFALLALARPLVPEPEPHARSVAPPPRWDLPARAVLATSLVVLFTAVATTVGARLTGLLTVFPLYATVLAMFAHGTAGRSGALQVLRGVVLGLYAYVTFCFTSAALLGRIDTVAAFAIAATAALLVQASTLVVVRRSPLAEAAAAGRLDAHDGTRA